jgi:hypothetical protein
MKTAICLGQPSWRFASDRVEAFVTRRGGHVAPVRFRLSQGVFEPFSVAPWAREKPDRKLPSLLQVLRGDFFCAPFGGNDTAFRGEHHVPHGEPANAVWRFKSLKKNREATELHLSLKTKTRPGRIDKFLRLRSGETALYCRHIISGMAGRMNLGHHAMLKCPDRPRSGTISTSTIKFAQVYPGLFEKPERKGYSILKPGAKFSRLDRVPRTDGGVADLSRYPERRGFEDLVMLVHEARRDFAWTAATFAQERRVWFSLKDPRVLRSTIFWISNGGRHEAPWSGRHINVLGLEDVTSYFHCGLAESARPNPVNRLGFPTSLSLHPKKPLVVNYIMAVAEIPRGFDRVKAIQPGRDEVTLVSGSRKRVTVPIDTSFLYENPL